MSVSEQDRIERLERQLAELAVIPRAATAAEVAAAPRGDSFKHLVARKQLAARARRIRESRARARIAQEREQHSRVQLSQLETRALFAAQALAELRARHKQEEEAACKQVRVADDALRAMLTEIATEPSESLLREAIEQTPAVPIDEHIQLGPYGPPLTLHDGQERKRPQQRGMFRKLKGAR
jgi:hypothetical protein